MRSAAGTGPLVKGERHEPRRLGHVADEHLECRSRRGHVAVDEGHRDRMAERRREAAAGDCADEAATGQHLASLAGRPLRVAGQAHADAAQVGVAAA